MGRKATVTATTPARKARAEPALKKASMKTAEKTAPKAKASAPPAKASPAKATRSKPKASSPPPKQEVITLKQLALQIGEDHDLPPKQAQAMLTGVVDLLVEHLKAGDKLRLKGLGVLEVKNRPARTGRNPATGATVQIAASKKIAFRPAKELKEAV
jgi:DNA-binding protein HU-beta